MLVARHRSEAVKLFLDSSFDEAPNAARRQGRMSYYRGERR